MSGILPEYLSRGFYGSSYTFKRICTFPGYSSTEETDLVVPMTLETKSSYCLCAAVCARVLRGACRYCSSTEWFVSNNVGAGRTVLRQERQDGRALEIKRVRETWRKGKVDKNNSNETMCDCKSPELGRVVAWL
ncbi:hypothetical protein E1301_Tti012011 [Triplophysa tibetana]|uniref:Uncharacterized protein n=1 Tax=Triplophysa tibetana TaxID=1572043 RepID=A0A5A9PMF1_9TELE|nr:hypothetical protein E1301_Tti012011 [Triplophysa tibetana]